MSSATLAGIQSDFRRVAKAATLGWKAYRGANSARRNFNKLKKFYEYPSRDPEELFKEIRDSLAHTDVWALGPKPLFSRRPVTSAEEIERDLKWAYQSAVSAKIADIMRHIQKPSAGTLRAEYNDPALVRTRIGKQRDEVMSWMTKLAQTYGAYNVANMHTMSTFKELTTLCEKHGVPGPVRPGNQAEATEPARLTA